MAPPRVRYAFPTQEAGASGALRPQAELLMLRNLAFHRTRTRNALVDYEYRWC